MPFNNLKSLEGVRILKDTSVLSKQYRDSKHPKDSKHTDGTCAKKLVKSSDIVLVGTQSISMFATHANGNSCHDLL